MSAPYEVKMAGPKTDAPYLLEQYGQPVGSAAERLVSFA